MTLSFVNFKEDMQVDKEICVVNADNATVTGTGVDMLGYQGVVFIATARQGEAATWTLKAQQDTTSAFSTAADLVGTGVSMTVGTESDGFAFVEIVQPQERYVRSAVVVPNITTATGLVVTAIRYGKNWRPETNSDGEIHIAPAEGTA